MRTIAKIVMLTVPVIMASCGAKKAAVGSGTTMPTAQVGSVVGQAAQSLAFVQKVSDQKVYAKNIVSGMTFTATMGDKNISLPGSIRMRKDEVIRLQIFVPILGSEVGRLEFTPDYVLVIDRMHKQYVKGDYNQLDFLRDNGLNFYSLQALFWNQLLLPGSQKVSEGDLQKFDATVDGTGENVPVTLKNGNLTYMWQAGRDNGRINNATVTYSGGSHGTSQLTWLYTDFKSLGAKLFPATQEFSFTTSATAKVKKTTIRIEMDDLKTSDDWETRTTVSPKYKQMDAEDILGKLLNM